VGKKPRKDNSVFSDMARKRQMNNYRLALLVLVGLMAAFAGLIFLGTFLGSLAGDPNEDGINAGRSDIDGGLFIPLDPGPTEAASFIIDAFPEGPPQPVDISEIYFRYNGVYLDVTQLESLDGLQTFIDNIKSKGINAVNIDIKKQDGSLPFHVNGQADAVAGTDNYISIPIRDIIDRLHENELYVSGTIACFKDNLASTMYINHALRSSGTAATRWEDADGNYWLNAYSEGARDYISSIVADSADLGFDEIILSWFFFPNVANTGAISYDIYETGMTRYAVVKDFVEAQRRALDNIDPGIKLGLEIPTVSFLNMPNEAMGLNPGELTAWCNFFATSFAPAHVPSGSVINGETITNPEGNIHGTVRALCAHFKYISDIAYFRPYLQAFGGFGNDEILIQRQALTENGINVWQLVSFDNNY
jgi:hypothetical protein